jgi:hypothetical protein
MDGTESPCQIVPYSASIDCSVLGELLQNEWCANSRFATASVRSPLHCHSNNPEGVLQAELFGHLRAPGVACERLAARHAPPDRRQLRFRTKALAEN